MLARINTFIKARVGKGAQRRSASARRRAQRPPPARVRALETMWGRGRYGPASGALDDRILDRLGFGPSSSGPIGMVGADPVLAAAAMNRFDTEIRIAEWRPACAVRSRDLEPDMQVEPCCLDREWAFDNDSLAGLVSVDATVFATHKSTIAANAFRALHSGGVWVLVDLIRKEDKPPGEAFASAWADGQPAAEDDVEHMLVSAGFEVGSREDISEAVAEAARSSFSRLQRSMEVVSQDKAVDSALMLQEMSWEAGSWKARARALQDGVLSSAIWVAKKTASEEANSEPVAADIASGD